MDGMLKINEYIYRLTIPFLDIFTTIYVVKTENGALLFDTATYNDDVDNYILPFLSKIGVTDETLRYILVSHNHRDHVGGLNVLMTHFPSATIISRSSVLGEKYTDYNFLCPNDNEIILDSLRIVTIPGHTMDCISVYDTKSKILISGDCLQLYGIYGSGDWGSNISLPTEHIKAIEKLRKIDISTVLTAHDYHPCGYRYDGKESIYRALDECVNPLYKIKDMIVGNPDLDDAQICAMYNGLDYPTLNVRVVSAVRRELL